MCESNCQGVCKKLINNNDNDYKESLTKVIDGLEKIKMCSTQKPDLMSSIPESYITKLERLKAEAKRLLEEVNRYSECGNKTEIVNPYVYEKAYEDYSLKERIKIIKEKAQGLEKSLKKVSAAE